MLECFKGKEGRLVYYLNGIRVNKAIAQAYAKQNNTKLPSCLRKKGQTNDVKNSRSRKNRSNVSTQKFSLKNNSQRFFSSCVFFVVEQETNPNP